MSDLTTSAGRDELRELAERRRGLSIGGYLVLEPEEVIALLDLADAGERRDAESSQIIAGLTAKVVDARATAARLTAALKQIAEWDMMSPDCWTMTNGSDFPFFRKLVLDALSDAAAAEVTKGDGP